MNHQKQLLFASANRHKLEEIRQIIPAAYKLSGLNDYSVHEEIPEPFDTFEANAAAKATYVYKKTGIPCFADDSGLVVDALDGRPGVLSARYAGEHKSSEENVRKLLSELTGIRDRTARFIAVIAYQENEKDVLLFKGTIEGTINYTPAGAGGFGYDPVFIPSGFDKTFAQLSPGLKNQISHRAKAIKLFLQYLSEQG
ncbi:MAG: RdgB/HAM1 family non-canonical purine NTP pyrophosphatase [Saprospiraceae bacterium]|nr:RdgB/HAM1 family non-canonical purine NTP pyrophosphatase [Candidatus Opimibacter skivensis]